MTIKFMDEKVKDELAKYLFDLAVNMQIMLDRNESQIEIDQKMVNSLSIASGCVAFSEIKELNDNGWKVKAEKSFELINGGIV